MYYCLLLSHLFKNISLFLGFVLFHFVFQKTGLGGSETVRIEQSMADGERLLYELSDLKVEIVELTRLASIKVRKFEI